MDPLYDDARVALPINLMHLPMLSLVELARHFVAMAGACAERADELHRRERRRAEIEATVARFVAAGRGDLIDPSIPAATVESWHRHFRREALVRDRRRRDLEIMRLAGRGWPNNRIGARMNLSPGRVSRIVRRELDATRPVASLKPETETGITAAAAPAEKIGGVE